jgi:hypothetical protein
MLNRKEHKETAKSRRDNSQIITTLRNSAKILCGPLRLNYLLADLSECPQISNFKFCFQVYLYQYSLVSQLEFGSWNLDPGIFGGVKLLIPLPDLQEDGIGICLFKH